MSMNFNRLSTDDKILIMEGAQVLGDVVAGEGTAFWYNSVCRGEMQSVRIGKRCNIQDLALIHNKVTIGDDVSVGHCATVHGATIGDRVIVVGEPGHPEVEGILGHAGNDAQVVSCAADANALSLKGKVGLVVQTTQTAQNLAEVVAAITPRVQELRVINTICAATSERQQAAATLANRCDCMVVVGGKNSGNTRRLAQICADACERTYHIEEASELQAAWFTDAHHIGITAGASTPQEHIERAVARIKELCR